MDFPPSLDSMHKKSATFLPLWSLVLLLTWLLFGLGMIGCCSTPVCPPLDPEVVVVDNSEISKNSDGTYTVTVGWMLRRLEYEQSLLAALGRCEEGMQ
jgi:hypothetical protein